MRIAIHDRPESFSDRWLKYCEKEGIPFKVVNCYDTNIIQKISDCDALMWHHSQSNSKDILFAKQLLFSIEHAGKKVFPDFKTAWHFDDKVGQKYLLESLGAELVTSYVFYSKNLAMDWVYSTNFPKVFKLRGGAASANVRLVRNRNEAKRLVNKSFGRGFKQYEGWKNLQERFRKFRTGNGSLFDLLKGAIRLLYPPLYSRIKGKERGYVYFQDFIPDNEYDIRVVVIHNKAFAVKRMTRKNDFRASGSGTILYEKEHFADGLIDLSFQLAEKLKSHCLAIDYVFQGSKPLVTEISYGFTTEGYDPCVGYWGRELKWHKGNFDPYGWMVESLIKEIHE